MERYKLKDVWVLDEFELIKGEGSKAYDASKHPHAPKGTTEGGQFVSTGEALHPSQQKQPAQAQPAEAAPTPNERSLRAKASYRPATKEAQRIADQQEAWLSQNLNGQRTPDNAPFDIILGRYGVEVKTLFKGENDKVTVHPESLRRKQREARQKKLRAVMVVVDIRGGTQQLFFRNSVGSFRLGAMEQLSLEELMRRLR